MDIRDKFIGGTPYKSYKKTILGKVYVTVWNSFEGVPEGLILSGDPRKNEDGCMIDTFNEDEDRFFRSRNKLHLQTGNVIEFQRKEEVRERTAEEYSDDEIKEILGKPFFSIQKLINNTESVALLFRVKNIAIEMEKSDQIMKVIESRISEVQANEYKQMPEVLEKVL